jgi:serine/threonine protein kinase
MLGPGDVVLQRYEIECLLGEGGMGAVFRARHVHLDTTVAVKVLNRPTSADREARTARFLREAKLIAKLNHPNVVRVVDFGTVEALDGAPCIVMELLDGPSFEDILIDRGAQPFQLALDVCIAAASALAAAHEQDVLHRDVKPANLVRANDGIRLVDFGIAIHLADDVRLTQSGSLVGTPMYMSPEHLLGAGASVASDIYALGVTLFEIMAGAAPFDDKDLGMLVQQAMKGPPVLRVPTHLEPPPGVLRQLVARMMSPSPERRPATAEQLLAEAQRIQKETRRQKARSSSAWLEWAALSDSSSAWPEQKPKPTSSVPPSGRKSDAPSSIRERGTWSRPSVPPPKKDGSGER